MRRANPVGQRTPRKFNRHLQCALLVCLGLSLPAQVSAQTAPAQTGAGAPNALTRVRFNVSDTDKRFVTSLRREDVRVSEDGVPQPVISFSPDFDAPLSLVIAIDNSSSQERLLPTTRKLAQALLGLLRSPADRAAVISFSGEVVLEQDFTGDQTRLHQAIEGVGFLPLGDPASTSTSFRDALWLVGQEVFTRTSAPASPPARRVLILLTDGADTSSETKKREALESILKTGAAIYAFVVGDPYYDNIDKGAMRSLTERTGGWAYFPRKGEELRPALEHVRAALRAEYVIAYATPAGKAGGRALRKLKLEIVNPEMRKRNLRLAHTQGYFVP
ncbi:MAG TPA: VWA domain-containing protein [Pyrinomonadaceae bacterium]|nr:VWA domain-containing protein [Pyrinomonadaceae bacterium]